MSFVSTFQNLTRKLKPAKATLKGKHADKEEKGVNFQASGLLASGEPHEVLRALCTGMRTTVPVSVPNAELLLTDTRTWEATQALSIAYVCVYGEPAGLPIHATYPTAEEEAEALELFAALAVWAAKGEKVDNSLAGAHKALATFRQEQAERERERVKAERERAALEALNARLAKVKEQEEEEAAKVKELQEREEKEAEKEREEEKEEAGSNGRGRRVRSGK
jgi:hypothetical protein